MKILIFSFTILIISLTSYSFVANDAWKLGDKNTITFSTSGVSGIFKTLTGSIIFNDKNLSTASFDISIDINSINTGNGMMNKHAKGEEWFDAAKYPMIKFNSKKIEKTSIGYTALGSLQMHGITKEITLPFTFTKNATGGLFEGEFIVLRTDFKIGEAGGEVGNEIKIKVSVPVVK